jgi:hypothetical protein
MSLSKSRRIITLLAVVFALSMSGLSPRLCAQSPGVAFTVDDLLDVANVNIVDLSDDGKWLVGTSGPCAIESGSTITDSEISQLQLGPLLRQRKAD